MRVMVLNKKLRQSIKRIAVNEKLQQRRIIEMLVSIYDLIDLTDLDLVDMVNISNLLREQKQIVELIDNTITNQTINSLINDLRTIHDPTNRNS